MRKKFVLTFIIWLICFAAQQTHATITAQLDRDRITEGETVRLVIEASGQVSAMPDTRPLDQDFEVTGTMSGSRVNIINGNMDSRTTWTISLIPKRSGELTIPSLKVNNDYTPALTIQVNETSAGTEPDADTPIFLETEVDKTDPYVQGMVRYTQRVFFAVNLTQGSLSEPEHENVLVQKLGEDREFQTTRHGKTYYVIEREFVIFPQTSGSLVIPGPVLNAQIPENTHRQDPFFDRFFTSNRPIRLRGEAITLDVRPRPKQNKSPYWLPAESIELLETWQPEDTTITFGDPITRNITIKALGVTGEQLPELKFSDPEGFKLYPDRTQSSTKNLSQTIQGEKILRLAYMPAQPGKHTLPAFTLHWWDTTTDSEQTVTLPARTIEVQPATDQQQYIPAPALDTPKADNTPPQTARHENIFNLDDNKKSGIDTPSAFNHSGWFWTTLLFAALWLFTLGRQWRRRHHPPKSIEDDNTSRLESKNARAARKRFLYACQVNDAQKARHHLLQWAATHWPQSPPRGLEELATRLNDPAVSKALTTLDRVLYQDDKDNWNGPQLAGLLTEFSQLNHNRNKNKNKGTLPELYS
ncbi:Oxygen tolerance [Nitrosomonas aestuarii]|uniref:Oxygen tolerance n=1 Tax=Nitrosomonas aestuarii TaxID=52441 RepID=A0A1I4BH34_9PROT|nr:BatD family protein [Nitrosomonas aestuarii]SFK68135.1 Oxygen tolerance [Nitrosomonas aestuarii]